MRNQGKDIHFNKQNYDFYEEFREESNKFVLFGIFEKFISDEMLAKRIIQRINEDLKLIKQNSVLVLGKTGSGKSTLINFLIGNKLEAYEDDDGFKKIRIIENPSNKCDLEIGSEIISETSIPNKCEDLNNDIVYWDFPTFKNNIVLEQEIFNNFYTKIFPNISNAIILIVVAEKDILEWNLKEFNEIITQVAKTFKENILDLRQRFNLVISFATSQINKIKVKKILENFLKQQSLSKEKKLIIEILLEKDDSILLFPFPDKIEKITNFNSRKSILKIIKSEYFLKLEILKSKFNNEVTILFEKISELLQNEIINILDEFFDSFFVFLGDNKYRVQILKDLEQDMNSCVKFIDLMNLIQENFKKFGLETFLFKRMLEISSILNFLEELTGEVDNKKFIFKCTNASSNYIKHALNNEKMYILFLEIRIQKMFTYFNKIFNIEIIKKFNSIYECEENIIQKFINLNYFVKAIRELTNNRALSTIYDNILKIKENLKLEINIEEFIQIQTLIMYKNQSQNPIIIQEFFSTLVLIYNNVSNHYINLILKMISEIQIIVKGLQFYWLVELLLKIKKFVNLEELENFKNMFHYAMNEFLSYKEKSKLTEKFLIKYSKLSGVEFFKTIGNLNKINIIIIDEVFLKYNEILLNFINEIKEDLKLKISFILKEKEISLLLPTLQRKLKNYMKLAIEELRAFALGLRYNKNKYDLFLEKLKIPVEVDISTYLEHVLINLKKEYEENFEKLEEFQLQIKRMDNVQIDKNHLLKEFELFLKSLENQGSNIIKDQIKMVLTKKLPEYINNFIEIILISKNLNWNSEILNILNSFIKGIQNFCLNKNSNFFTCFKMIKSEFEILREKYIKFDIDFLNIRASYEFENIEISGDIMDSKDAIEAKNIIEFEALWYKSISAIYFESLIPDKVFNQNYHEIIKSNFTKFSEYHNLITSGKLNYQAKENQYEKLREITNYFNIEIIGNVVFFIGNIIRISQVKKELPFLNIKSIAIIGFNSIFFDIDLNLPGVNVFVLGPKWYVNHQKKINLVKLNGFSNKYTGYFHGFCMEFENYKNLLVIDEENQENYLFRLISLENSIYEYYDKSYLERLLRNNQEDESNRFGKYEYAENIENVQIFDLKNFVFSRKSDKWEEYDFEKTNENEFQSNINRLNEFEKYTIHQAVRKFCIQHEIWLKNDEFFIFHSLNQEKYGKFYEYIKNK